MTSVIGLFLSFFLVPLQRDSGTVHKADINPGARGRITVEAHIHESVGAGVFEIT